MVSVMNWSATSGLLYLLLAFFPATDELEDPENFDNCLGAFYDF